MTRCEPPCIHPDDIIGANAIRNLASGRRHKPIARNTLKAWRRGPTDRFGLPVPGSIPFPKPVAVLKGAGPGGSDIELWDRRAVKEWLKDRA